MTGVPDTMPCLRLHATADAAGGTYREPALRLEDQPLPVREPGQLLVRVAYCGICGSDYAMAARRADGAIEYGGLCRPPVTLGHELSGWVEAGERFPAGCPVVVEETSGCGCCSGCRSGHEEACAQPEKIGFTRDGAYAPFLLAPEHKAWSLEPVVRAHGMDLGLRLGALVQPYAIAFSFLHPAGGAGFRAGQSALFVGAGPLALAAVDLARAGGASRIGVLEPIAERLELARRLGATAPEPGKGGYDWLVDSSGSGELPRIAAEFLAPGGRIVLLHKRPAFVVATLREAAPACVSVATPDGHQRRDAYPEVLARMASGALRAALLVDQVTDLDGARDFLSRQRRTAGKILVRPQRGAAFGGTA